MSVLAEDATKKATASTAPVSSEAVARVGDTVIKRRDLDMAVNGFVAQMQQRGQTFNPAMLDRLQLDLLNQLVSRELILQEARAHPTTGLDEKVKTVLDRNLTMAGGEEGLAKALEQNGVTRAQYEKETRDAVMAMETLRIAVEPKTKVTDEEMKSFYQANTNRFVQPEMVRASHILVRVPADATDEIKKTKKVQIDAARSLVMNGEKFADIASKVSEDPGSAPKGGDLDFFPRGAMVPEFDQVAFKLQTNKVSEVITTQFGYHVLMVTDHKDAKTLSFEEVKPDLEQYLRQRKGNDVAREYVDGLRAKAKVEILLPPLPAPATNAPPAAPTWK